MQPSWESTGRRFKQGKQGAFVIPDYVVPMRHFYALITIPNHLHSKPNLLQHYCIFTLDFVYSKIRLIRKAKYDLNNKIKNSSYELLFKIKNSLLIVQRGCII